MKKDSNSLNGSFWEGIKRYCLCDTNTTRKKTNFILPSYKSNSDELRFFCCLGFFFVCFWFFSHSNYLYPPWNCAKVAFCIFFEEINFFYISPLSSGMLTTFTSEEKNQNTHSRSYLESY